MSTVAAFLEVRIGADMKPLEKAIASLPNKFKPMHRSMDQLGKSMTRGVTLPIMGMVGGLLLVANRAANFADEIDKTAIRTGLSRTALQEFRFAADQLGVSFESVQGVIESFSRRIPMIESGTGEAAKVMQTLGVEIRGADGQMREMSDLFPEVLKRLSDMRNETERNALATQIFGRRAFEIVPFLNAGSSGIEKLTARAHELGLVMGDEQVASLVAYKDAMSEVKQALGALGRDMALEIIPILKDDFIPLLRDKIIPGISSAVRWIGGWSDSTKTAAVGVTALAVALGPLATVMSRVLVVLPYLAKGLAILAGTKGLIAGAAVGLGLIGRDLYKTQKAVTDVDKAIQKLAESADTLTRAELENMKVGFEKRLERANELVDRGNKSLAEHGRLLGVSENAYTGAIEAQTKMTWALGLVNELLTQSTSEADTNTAATATLTTANKLLSDELKELDEQYANIIHSSQTLTAQQLAEGRAVLARKKAIEEMIELNERLLGQTGKLEAADIKVSASLVGMRVALEGVAETVEKVAFPKWNMLTTHLTDQFYNAAGQAAEALLFFTASGTANIKEFGSVFVNEMKRMVKATIAFGIANAIAAHMKFSILGVGLGAVAGSAAAALFNSMIPSFGDGAFVKGNTLAIVGDHPQGEFIIPKPDFHAMIDPSRDREIVTELRNLQRKLDDKDFSPVFQGLLSGQTFLRKEFKEFERIRKRREL
jgi:hypothetical protein